MASPRTMPLRPSPLIKKPNETEYLNNDVIIEIRAMLAKSIEASRRHMLDVYIPRKKTSSEQAEQVVHISHYET